MPVIYEPTGAAKEYADLGLNLYHGCRFACRYCYAPGMAFKKLAEWSANPQPKKDILQRIAKDAKKMSGDPRTVLLCFTSDPYQSPEAAALTRQALLMLEKYNMTATVLTKGGIRAIQDFDILKRNNWQFGTTLSYTSSAIRCKWEPFAAAPRHRIETIIAAHKEGIKTWVSVEPVMDTKEALGIIKLMAPYVDFWKIGKMNHRSLDIDWGKCHNDAVKLLESLGAKYYIKKELRKFSNE